MLADSMKHFKETEGGKKTMCKAVEEYAKEYAKEVAEEVAKEVVEKEKIENDRKWKTCIGRYCCFHKFAIGNC